MSFLAEPLDQKYLTALNEASSYATTAAQALGNWNNHYLAGLYRHGLALTQNEAWLLVHDESYPNGKPVRACVPASYETDAWPFDTWVIWRP